MTQFFSFFIILLTAVLFSNLFNRMRVPWVAALILGGIIIGPYGLGFFTPNDTINFLASIGLVFLMFMAGLETRLSDIKGIKLNIVVIALFSGLIPALVGMSIALLFGYSLETALLLGIVFMASSIALLIPSFHAIGILGSSFGKMIIGATILIDSTGLILLSLFLHTVAIGSFLEAVLFYPALIIMISFLAWIIPKIRKNFPEYAEEQDLFEKELRFIILVLVGLVVFFELFGLHAIIAGFFAGVVLSKSVESRITKAKLHAVGYGLFIPLFFVVIGATINMGIFMEATNNLLLAAVIIIGSIGSKIFSGWLAGKIRGFNSTESLFIGVSTAPSLSTTLAIAFLGFGQGIFAQELLASIVALSVTTSIITPFLVNTLSKKIESQKVALRGVNGYNTEVNNKK